MSVIDIAWPLGFIVITLGSLPENLHQKHFIVLLMVLVWGLRLATYLFFRNLKVGEDWRYAEWRRQWGNRVILVSYFKVYWLQTFLLLLVSLPLLLGLPTLASTPLQVIQFLGLALWLLGITIQTTADYQLAKHKALKSTKILTTGIWKYSRHPNYLGEFLVWWGILFFLWNEQMGLFLLMALGPAFLSFLLLRVSGVPMLEKKWKNNAHYQEYCRKTPSFFPSLKKVFDKS